jgi:hypothetical protein
MSLGENKPLALTLITFLTFLFYQDCHCQTIVSQQKNNEEIYLARTKQFNEFLDRFNYKTDFRGNPVDSIFRVKMPRGKMVGSLFDLKDNRIISGTETYSRNYADLKSTFIKEVMAKNAMIDKHSSAIIAEARSKVTFNNIPHTISIFLNQENVGTGIKWVILDVKGDIMNFLLADTAYVRFISPTSNETDFMNLKRALEDSDHLQYYASKGFRFDPVSAFFFGINSKQIKFEYVEQVIYHILDLPGWCVIVKDFNRTELNSGWLIYDLSTNSLSVGDYLKNLVR